MCGVYVLVTFTSAIALIIIPADMSPARVAYFSLRLCGVMNQQGRPWSLVHTVFQMTCTILMMIFSVLDLFVGDEELPELVMAMTSTMISVQVNSKAVNILLHQTELRQILDRIDKLRNDILQDTDKRHYILNGEQSAKQYLGSYGIFIAIVLTFSMFSNAALDFSTNMEKPHLLLQTWIPWKMSTGWLYAAGQIFNCFCVLPTAFLYVVYVGLNFMFTYEMSAFLKVLQARMKEMKRLDDPEIYRQHREILTLLTDYNDLFSGLMYIEVLVSPLEPCGFGFALMKTIHTNLFVSLDLFCKFLVAVLASFILCACGQEISTQVDNLHESAYMSSWYNEEPAMRKYLLQLMTITVQPNGLCYRKMLMFNFVCFTSIAQAIYSYLSMVSQFDQT